MLRWTVLFLSFAFAAPTLVLPPNAEESAWRTPAALTGFSLADTGDRPLVRLIPADDTWVVVAVSDGAERRMSVPAPVTAQDREDLLWLAASLIDPLPSPPRPVPVVRKPPPPPPAPVDVVERVEGVDAAAPEPVVLAPTPVVPVPDPAPVIVEPSTPERRRKLALSLSAGLGFVRPDASGTDGAAHLGLDVALFRSVSVGLGLRVQGSAAFDTTLGAAWRPRGRFAPYAALDLGGSSRRIRFPDGTTLHQRSPLVELDVGGAARVSPRFELRPLALFQLDPSRASSTVRAGDVAFGEPPVAPDPALRPAVPPSVMPADPSPWRWGGALVVAWRFF